MKRVFDRAVIVRWALASLIRSVFLPPLLRQIFTICILCAASASGQVLPFHTYTAKDGLSRNDIRTMCQDLKGFLWLGSTEGLNRYDGATFESLRIPGEPRSNFINDIIVDSSGTIWIASNFAGLLSYRESGFTVFPVNPGEPNSGENRVNTVMPEAEGKLIVGTDRGLFEFDGHGFRKILPGDPLLQGDVLSIRRDRSGFLWVGTGRGLCRIPPGGPPEGEPLHTLRGLEVRRILQDERGFIWIATDRGIRCVSPDAGLEIDRAAAHVPAPARPLAATSTLSMLIDGRGSFWFGSTYGVTRYSPLLRRPVLAPPSVVIRKVQILGKEDQGALQTLHADLSYDQHSLGFEFVGISFRDESRVRYRYMLEGLDTTWNGETDRRYSGYTHLPPGEYRFAVMSRNADGVWSTSPATFRFTIAQPFWQSWWVISFSICCISFTVYAAHRYRLHKLLEVERIRARIAADLHDEIGSTLSSISIFSEMARQEVISDPPSATQYLGRIGEISREVLESFDDIVWAINPAHESLHDVVLRLREFAAELFEARGIELVPQISQAVSSLTLPMDMRRHFYLMCKEALANVAKHSQCTHALLEVELEHSLLTVTIRDDGIGFEPGHNGTRNGLHNLRKRSAAVGGTLSVESAEGSGTTVRLQVRIT